MALAAKVALVTCHHVPKTWKGTATLGEDGGTGRGVGKQLGPVDVTLIPFPPCSTSSLGNEMKRTQGHQRSLNDATDHLTEILEAIQKKTSCLLGG